MNVKKLLFIILCLILAAILLFVFIIRITDKNQGGNSSQDRDNGSTDTPLRVVATEPASGELEIYPGEIKIKITLNREIFSENEIGINIAPQPSAGFELLNSFPTKELTLQILGGLTPSTTHTITIRTLSGETLYTWTFTTSNKTPESSSAEVNKIQRETVSNYYPLFDFVPYQTDQYTVDYTGRLTLEVKINGTKTPQVENSVENWIRGKGVDPSTHTIVYISQ